MENPIQSQFDTDPWQPTASKSDKDYSDEEKAVASYDKDYGSAPYTAPSGGQSSSSPGNGVTYVYDIPSLVMVYTEAPELIPQPSPSGGSGGSGAADLSYVTAVNLGDLRAAEQTCLYETSNLIDSYNTLKDLVTAATSSGTIFGQEVTDGSSTVGGYTHPATDESSPSTPVKNSDKLDQEGLDFASSMDSTMEQLLQASGNAIESLGMFNAMLNTAGQLYAETDSTALNGWRNQS